MIAQSMPRPRRTAPASNNSAPIDLALQGGGSHGAFTWGVLDRLLEDTTLPLAGISGTSAGALNAAVLATGFAQGGREGARAALSAFWRDVGQSQGCFGGSGTPPALPWLPMNSFNLHGQWAFEWTQALMRAFSPYEFNPLNLNPLRDTLVRHVQPEALRSGPLPLFIAATSVHTGQPRIFTREDLSIDALLASACLPQLFQALQIDGVPYWDGGYSGNPALWPLIYDTAAHDILLVRINPLKREALPTKTVEIGDRLNEITFNAGLVGEMRAIAFVNRLLKDNQVKADRYKQLRLHMVADDASLAPLNASSKMNTAWPFLERLFTLGRAAAEQWFTQDRPQVGKRGTVDIEATFLQPR
jgi:NTE family protein